MWLLREYQLEAGIVGGYSDVGDDTNTKLLNIIPSLPLHLLLNLLVTVIVVDNTGSSKGGSSNNNNCYDRDGRLQKIKLNRATYAIPNTGYFPSR